MHKTRQSLSQVELSVLAEALRSKRRRFIDDPMDVFCVTKRFMHSVEPNGPPTLILPASRCKLLPHGGPTGTALKSYPMTDSRRDALRDLATRLECATGDWGPAFSYFRGAASLWQFSEATPADGTPAQHLWLRNHVPPPVAEAAPVTQNRYYNTLPDMAWQLLARFRNLSAV